MPHEIHTYTELKQQIHEDLRSQHPDWIQPNGKCPECDEHEARLKELFEALRRAESNTATSQRALVEDQISLPPHHETS